MEYVIVAVLIAAACMLGVLLLGRSIARGWGVSVRSAVANANEAAEKQEQRSTKVLSEAEEIRKYNSSFHDAGDK